MDSTKIIIKDPKEHEAAYRKWNKEVNEKYYSNIIHGEMQDWQKEDYEEVIHPTAKEAESFTTKTKKFFNKLFA